MVVQACLIAHFDRTAHLGDSLNDVLELPWTQAPKISCSCHLRPCNCIDIPKNRRPEYRTLKRIQIVDQAQSDQQQ